MCRGCEAQCSVVLTMLSSRYLFDKGDVKWKQGQCGKQRSSKTISGLRLVCSSLSTRKVKINPHNQTEGRQQTKVRLSTFCLLPEHPEKKKAHHAHNIHIISPWQLQPPRHPHPPRPRPSSSSTSPTNPAAPHNLPTAKRNPSSAASTGRATYSGFRSVTPPATRSRAS